LLAVEDEVGLTSDEGKGPRLITAHVGGETCFVDNTLLIYK
jgi:hypothetical protein